MFGILEDMPANLIYVSNLWNSLQALELAGILGDSANDFPTVIIYLISYSVNCTINYNFNLTKIAWNNKFAHEIYQKV